MAASEDSRYLVDFPARNTESRVMAAYGVGVRCVQQAVHLAVRVVKEFDLTNAKLIGFAILRFLRDLCDGCFG